MRTEWKGIMPALSTVTDTRGEIDEESMRSLVQFNIEKGTHALAALIGAGEFYKFSDTERMKVAEIVVDETCSGVPALIGISHSGTDPAVNLGRHAEDIGSDGLILMPTYFRKEESTLSLYGHYSTIAQKIDLPIMIQDGEAWTGVHMCPTFMHRLVEEYSNFVSIKLEGPSSLEKLKTVKKLVGEDIAIFGGMAASQMLQELELGACGNIPDSCLTDLLVDVYNNYTSGNRERSEDIFSQYKVWLDFLRKYGRSSAEVEKETLRIRGVIKSSYTRYPKFPLGEEAKLELEGVLRKIGLI